MSTPDRPNCYSRARNAGKFAHEIRHTPPSPLMVNEAAETVYRAWLPHVGDAEAREQAEAFARRFHILIDGPLCPLPAANR